MSSGISKFTRKAIRNLVMSTSLLTPAALAFAQSPEVLRTPAAATAPTAVPALIPFSGTVESSGVKAVTGPATMTFLIFKDEQGGEPLWSESQLVNVDSQQHYSAKLGATLTKGLPEDLFSSGEARWLEVQIAGQVPQPRVLLLSVPYALKAADATTLGGLPVSAFALAGSASSARSQLAAEALASSSAASSVTTPGGAAGYLPVFTGAAAIGDSAIFQSGSDIGINTKTPAATLDINGPTVARGIVALESTGAATASTGRDSQPIDLIGSTYNSGTKTAVNEIFSLQVEPVDNNTNSPDATLNILYGSGSSTSETGLSINSRGILKFAPGQTFPSQGSITSVTAGSGLLGGGSTGAITLSLNPGVIPTLGDSPTFNAGASTGAQGFTSGAANNTAGFIGTAGARSGYSGIAGVWGDSYYHVGIYGSSFLYAGVDGVSTHGPGVQGSSSNSSGVMGAVGVDPPEGTAGVTGVAGNPSGLSGIAGVRGDAAEFVGVYGSSTDDTGVFGASTNSYGVYGTSVVSTAASFENNSEDQPTIFAVNHSNTAQLNPGSQPMFKTFEAVGRNGTCGIGDKGDLTCTGQVKTLATTSSGTRTVETYAMQSPENWMEDFGSGDLQQGAAKISLDSAFAETVSGSADYHVFLTPRGDSKGLYVSNVTATGFEVHESGGGKSSLAFDYRIVAKRRGFESQRLVDVTDRFKAEQVRVAKRLQAKAKLQKKPIDSK